MGEIALDDVMLMGFDKASKLFLTHGANAVIVSTTILCSLPGLPIILLFCYSIMY